jgi:hypothetical protein
LSVCTTLALASWGCGSSEKAEFTWDAVRTCLTQRGISEIEGVPPSGAYAPPAVVPLNFGDAPGGWLMADVRGKQMLWLFFYGDPSEAEHAASEPKAHDPRPPRTKANVIYIFSKRQTLDDSALLESCLATPFERSAREGAPRSTRSASSCRTTLQPPALSLRNSRLRDFLHRLSLSLAVPHETAFS